MGLLKWLIVKQVTTSATKGIIKAVGHTVVDTTAGVYREVDRHNLNDKQSKEQYKEQLREQYRERYLTSVHSGTKETTSQLPDIEEYIGEHYLEARAAFVQAGFVDISFVEIPDIKKGWFCKEGEVEKISVGGKKKLGKKEKIDINTPVVIFYHTFVKKSHATVPQQMLHPNNQNMMQPVNATYGAHAEHAQYDQQHNISNGVRRVYCTECGSAQPANNRFCSSCGQQLHSHDR